jgi:uncharacterized protein (UPF0261 family)
LNDSERVLLVATMDTKGREALYIEDCLNEAGIPAVILDAGIRGRSPTQTGVSREVVAKAGGKPLGKVQCIGNEGEALDVMIKGAIQCAQDLYRQGKIRGIISLGGSMGTTLGTAVMRTFPVGFPKVMISTMASRDTRAFVESKDILMLHSVCDISGLNRITKRVLRNGAMALAGMVQNTGVDVRSDKPLVILSTLGTTEVCVQRLREYLERHGKEVITFHTVGSGGKAMERMIQEENVEAVVDLSLHEIADHLFGGDYDAGPGRGSTALQKSVPTVLVPGNMDFLVTGPLTTAKARFPNRPFHKHNAAITTVRTDQKEMEILAQVIVDLCNEAKGPWRVLIPMKGLSAFDSEQGPFYDPKALKIFSETLKREVHTMSFLHFVPHHINDPEFAQAVIRVFESLLDH